MGEYEGTTAEGEAIICQRERAFPEHWPVIFQHRLIIPKGVATLSTPAEMITLNVQSF